jgi:hypothetical protein
MIISYSSPLLGLKNAELFNLRNHGSLIYGIKSATWLPEFYLSPLNNNAPFAYGGPPSQNVNINIKFSIISLPNIYVIELNI